LPAQDRAPARTVKLKFAGMACKTGREKGTYVQCRGQEPGRMVPDPP
jgi:hypothetical protein